MTNDKYISNWYWIKQSVLSKYGFTLDSLQERLTINPRIYDPDDPPEPMLVYNMSVTGYIGVPIYFGIQTFGGVGRERNLTSYPKMKPKKLPDSNHAQAPAGQDTFIEDILNACRVNKQFSVKGRTAVGKTVCALSVAGQLEKAMLVIVPNIGLLKQWTAEAILHLGLTPDDIGVVQSDKCEYKGKSITIASVKSLRARQYDPEFYEYFSIICMDELHTLVAQEIHKVLGQFNAPIQFGMTATPKRKDGRYEVADLWFGRPVVDADAKPMDAVVVPVINQYTPTSSKNDRNLQIYLMARNFERNNKLGKLTHWLGETKGRYVLGIGDNIAQLQYIANELIKKGVNPDSIGYLVDQLLTGKYRAKIKLRSEKEIGSVKFNTLMDKIKSSEHFDDEVIRATKKSISIREFNTKQIGKSSVESWINHEGIREIIYSTDFEEVRVKVSDEDKLRTINSTEVKYVLASYGAMKFGGSVKRLDAMVEFTPRSEAEQLAGRVRRLLDGKPIPRIYTLLDEGLPRMMVNINNSRMKEYQSLEGLTISKPLNLK